MNPTGLRVLSTIAFALEDHGGTTPFLRQAEDVVKQLAAEGLAIVPVVEKGDLAARLRAAFDKALRAENLACYLDGLNDTRKEAADAAAEARRLIEEVGRP